MKLAADALQNSFARRARIARAYIRVRNEVTAIISENPPRMPSAADLEVLGTWEHLSRRADAHYVECLQIFGDQVIRAARERAVLWPSSSGRASSD